MCILLTFESPPQLTSSSHLLLVFPCRKQTIASASGNIRSLPRPNFFQRTLTGRRAFAGGCLLVRLVDAFSREVVDSERGGSAFRPTRGPVVGAFYPRETKPSTPKTPPQPKHNPKPNTPHPKTPHLNLPNNPPKKPNPTPATPHPPPKTPPPPRRSIRLAPSDSSCVFSLRTPGALETLSVESL